MRTRERVYISGKVTAELFAMAGSELKAMGLRPVSPMTMAHDHDRTWQSYMRACIRSLCECDGIYMLTNWRESRGAVLELDLAKALGLAVMYQQGE